MLRHAGRNSSTPSWRMPPPQTEQRCHAARPPSPSCHAPDRPARRVGRGACVRARRAGAHDLDDRRHRVRPARPRPQCGDGGPGARATVGFPQGVALDPGGDVYIADMADNEVRKLSPAGVITIVAGDGTPCQVAPACGDGGPATSAQLNAPTGVAVDSHGDVFIADAGDEEIREGRAQRHHHARSPARGPSAPTPATCGDGGPALLGGAGLARRGRGRTRREPLHRRRRATTRSAASTRTGRSPPWPATARSAAPRRPAATAGRPPPPSSTTPRAVAFDAHGAMVIADNGDNEVRRVSGGQIARVAGTGAACASAPSCGDGGSALSATLNAPEGVAVDRSGRGLHRRLGRQRGARGLAPRDDLAPGRQRAPPVPLAPACGDTGAAERGAAELSRRRGRRRCAATCTSATRSTTRCGWSRPRARRRRASRGAHGSSALLAFATDDHPLGGRRASPCSAARRACRCRWPGAGRRRCSPCTRRAAGGLAQLVWNRHLKSRVAPRGRYTLTVAARYGTHCSRARSP